MSKLDELIKELCPDGVEYKRLGEIGTLIRGNGLQKKDFTKSGVGCIHYGQIYTHYGVYANQTISFVSEQTAKKLKKVEPGDLVITSTSENVEDVCKCVAWLGKESIVTGGHAMIFKHHENPKYLSYFFQSSQFFRQKVKMAIGVKVIDVSPQKLEKTLVPIPPLEVQREIVKILDNFTELTAELTDKLSEELTARKKQYEYYRDRLLTFESIIPVKSLGELCEISAGGDVPKNSWSKVRSDKFKVPIISNGVGTNALYGYTDVAKITGPSVTIAARGTIGYAEYRDYPYFPIIRLLSLIPKDEKSLNTRYLYYCLQGKQYKVPTTGIPQLTAPVLKKVKIPVPAIQVQERIVNVLDNFDKVCNDLHIGLPAEIEARKKQYEFYRDSLLTFLEKGESILTEQNRTELRYALIKLLQYVFGFVWIPLGSISENLDSYRKPIKQGNRVKGIYPYYGASGIVDYVKDYIFDGNFLLVSEDGANLTARVTPIAFSITGKNWVNNHAHVLKFHDLDMQKYVEFYLNFLNLQSVISGAAQPKLTKNNLDKIKIPVPDENVLKKIVSILERFATICHDISSGLPAEIEARKKQYEYYRDKLLDFKEKKG